MCDASKISHDWVTKGCHIHVNGIELNLYTNHLGRLEFRAVFASAPAEHVQQAIRIAKEECLRDPVVRTRWLRRLEMARIFMLDYPGSLRSLANGRIFDFKFIRIAIERWGEEDANL